MGSLNIDAKLLMSDSQALTATAASTNVIDFEVANPNMGEGTKVVVKVICETALGGTDPTITFTLQDSADNSTFATLLATEQYSSLSAGDVIDIPLPEDHARYTRMYYTLGGTSPTLTVSAYATAL